MKRQFELRIVVLGLILSSATLTLAQGQDNPTPGDQASGGPAPTYVHPETLPSLDFLSQAMETSGLKIGVLGGASYDSAGGAFSPDYGSVTRLTVGPTLELLQIRPKLQWRFDYRGLLTDYTSGQESNLYANYATADILYQLAPHWQIHANDRFTYSNDPFGAIGVSAGPPSANDPNPTAYYQSATTTQNYGVLDLTNQLTAHDTLTFSGTESFRRYSNQSQSINSTFFAENLVSYGGRANYSHNFSSRLALGGGYNYTSLDFGHGQQRSGVQNIQFTVDYQISPSMTVSGWIGPQYTTTKNIILLFNIFPVVVHEAQWSTAGGGTFGWKGLRNSFRAGYSQQVTDGGGIIGTTQLKMVNADFRRQLAPRWDLTFAELYGHNVSVSQLISANKRRFDSTITTVTLNWKMTPEFSARFFYAYLYETQQNIYLYPTYSDNRVGITLQYIWGHSLGR